MKILYFFYQLYFDHLLFFFLNIFLHLTRLIFYFLFAPHFIYLFIYIKVSLSLSLSLLFIIIIFLYRRHCPHLFVYFLNLEPDLCKFDYCYVFIWSWKLYPLNNLIVWKGLTEIYWMVLPSMEPLCAALAPLIYKSSKRLVWFQKHVLF